jgi:cytochrome oxidase assembly protein ShyY1
MILRLFLSRPYIGIATLLTVIVCIFFISTKNQAAKEGIHNQRLFHERGELQTLTRLPLPIEYNSQFTQDLLYRKVRLTGSFLQGHLVYLENRHSEAKPEPNSKQINGFQIMAPFLLNEGQIVWVNAGWIPRDPSNRLSIPSITLSKENTVISGYISAVKNNIFDMPKEKAHLINGHVIALNFYLHDDLKALPNQEVYPFLIMQTEGTDNALIRPSAGYFYIPDYSFDISSWKITLIVALLFWLISGVVTLMRDKSINKNTTSGNP